MFAVVILLAVLCLLGAAGINVLNAQSHQNAVREGRVREALEITSTKLRTFRMWTLACCMLAGVVAVIGVAVNPYVRVWTHGMDGQAQMAQAGERSIKPLVDLSEYEYGTKLYATDFKNGKQT